MTNKEKPLEWIASSHKDLMALPSDVRRRFGYALSLAQIGDQDDAAKELKGFGGAGVLKVVEDDAGGTYRAVYTVKFAEAVFVLHCFQKKSKSGIATPKADMGPLVVSCGNQRRQSVVVVAPCGHVGKSQSGLSTCPCGLVVHELEAVS